MHRALEPSQNDAIGMLLENEDIGWKALLYDLVSSEQMNPWDIDIAHLTKRYVERIKTMRETDFRISGKVLLAAAILLKIKTDHFVEHGIDELERLLNRMNEPDFNTEFFSEFSPDLFKITENIDRLEPKLIPRTPQPRHRKITIYDLAEALQKAMEVKKRRLMRNYPTIKIDVPKRKVDITQVIRGTYGKIKSYFLQNPKSKLTFTQLLSSEPTRDEKIYTFIPMLHLDNQRKIDITQQEHFGDIEVQLAKKELATELH